MSFEFDEVVREQAEQAHHRLNQSERWGEAEGIGEVLEPLDAVIGQLEGALAEARSLREEVADRVGEVRRTLPELAICDMCGGECSEEQDVLHERHYYECDGEVGGVAPSDYSDGPLERPLERLYENGEFAQDGDFENITADEVL